MAIATPDDFNRGMDLYRQGRSTIRATEEIAEGYLVITAFTKDDANYIQSVSVRVDGHKVSLSGRCSCERTQECAHVISAALTYMNEHAVAPTRKVVKKSDSERWLETLEKRMQPEPVKKSILIYRISPTETKGRLQLVFYRARLLKEGGYGKQKRIEFHQLRASFMQRDFLTDEDRAILELFGALETKVERTAPIEGKLGGLLLERMVRTGHCYWHGNRNRALVWGETLQTSLEYKKEKGGHRLGFGLGKQFEMLATVPTLYVDTREHRIGRLSVEALTAQEVPLLLEAPLLTDDTLEAFAFKAIEHLPALPFPEHIEVRSIRVRPQAKLTLSAEAGVHQVRISFLYEGHELSSSTSQKSRVLKVEEGYLKIVRDQDFERELTEGLQACGLEQCPEGHFLPQKEGENSVAVWRRFLEASLPEYEAQGTLVEVQKSFMICFEKGGAVSLKVQENQNWFDLEMEMELGGEKIDILSLVSALLEAGSDIEALPERVDFEVEENHYITLEAAQFKPILRTLVALYKGERVEQLHLAPYALHLLPETGDLLKIEGSASTKVKKIRTALRSFEGIEKVSQASGLKATLRDYQQEGLNWLGFLETFGFGGILADDMGLGKTLQTLAFLQRLKEQQKLQRPVLIVAPTSLLGNWKNEVKKFTPDLSLSLHHGTKRAKRKAGFSEYDIIVTTYALLSRDSKLFEQVDFSYFILDEAQNIKNQRSKVHAAAKQIKADHAVALSGTPMENHLGELWAIFDVVIPHFLGDYSTFKQFYQTPIEKEHSQERQESLRQKIAPFMLRRTKEKVAKELPPKTIMTRSVPFESDQAKLYEGIRIAMEKKVRDVIAEQGLGRSHITILDALLKLRQVCCDPRLVPLKEAQSVAHSAKLEMLLELVEELLEEGRRILIFSQFTSMLSIIEAALVEKGVTLAKLTGASQHREKVIERFTSGAASVFLISLKAGGVGLNLTEADTVIHYDPWWNPAAEDQATDRAYRIGQEKPVFVYKLIIENSVEEKILELQQQKKERADALYSDTEGESVALDSEGLLALFS